MTLQYWNRTVLQHAQGIFSVRADPECVRLHCTALRCDLYARHPLEPRYSEGRVDHNLSGIPVYNYSPVRPV